MIANYDKISDLDSNNILKKIINVYYEIINLDSIFELQIDSYLKDFENTILKKIKDCKKTESLDKKISEIEKLEEELEIETDLFTKNFYLLKNEIGNQKTLNADLSILEETLKRELENLSLIKEKEEIISNNYSTNNVCSDKDKALEWLKKELKIYKEAFQISVERISNNIFKIEIDNITENKIKIEIEIKIEKGKFLILNVFPKINYENYLIYLAEECGFDLSYFIISLVIEVLNKYNI